MPRYTLIAWLLILGAALWLSSHAVDTHPQYAMVTILAVLVFAASRCNGYGSRG